MAILLAPFSPLLAHQLVTNGPNFDPVNHAPSVAHMRMHKRSGMGLGKNFRYLEFLAGLNSSIRAELHKCKLVFESLRYSGSAACIFFWSACSRIIK